jgi:hypothetical protein
MRRLGIVATVIFVLAAAPAGAQTILGTTGTGGTISTLVEIDPATGALISTIGSVGYAVNGLTWDASSGTLYATTSANDAVLGSGLITIDPLTGSGTPIGTGHGLGSGATVTAASNAAGQIFSWWDPSADDLVIFDIGTGLATVVGESGLSTGAHGLTFDAADVLYLVNWDTSVYTINTTTGAATLVGSLGLATYAHHGDFDPSTGLYYGIDNTGGPGPRNLVVADLSTFTVVNTLPTVADLHTLTFYDAAPLVLDSIPTVSPWGAGVMILLVVVAGAILLRRFM